MPMSTAGLKAEMKAAVLGAIEALYANIADDENLGGYSTADYWDKVCGAIATTVINHIKNNAQLQGTDSGGDSHNLMSII